MWRDGEFRNAKSGLGWVGFFVTHQRNSGGRRRNVAGVPGWTGSGEGQMGWISRRRDCPHGACITESSWRAAINCMLVIKPCSTKCLISQSCRSLSCVRSSSRWGGRISSSRANNDSASPTPARCSSRTMVPAAMTRLSIRVENVSRGLAMNR